MVVHYEVDYRIGNRGKKGGGGGSGRTLTNTPS